MSSRDQHHGAHDLGPAVRLHRDAFSSKVVRRAVPIGWLAMERMRSVAPSPSAPTTLPAPPPVAPALTRRNRRRQGSTSRRDFPHIVRWASHGLVWIALLVPMASELARGWRPHSDNADIAARAYQSLSLHPPLVG